MTLIILAKFSSRCLKCNSLINVGERVNWEPGQKGVTHEDSLRCNELKIREMQESTAAQELFLRMKPVADVFSLVDLKKPTLRLRYANDEVVLSLTRTGYQPGSIAIKVAGQFVGCIRKDGEMSTVALRNDVSLQDYLLATVTSKDKLIAAAVEYAKLTNSCGFCGLELTNDYSVIVGYGPICAEKWGLPHYLNGTADRIVPASLPVDMKLKLMKVIMSDEE